MEAGVVLFFWLFFFLFFLMYRGYCRIGISGLEKLHPPASN